MAITPRWRSSSAELHQLVAGPPSLKEAVNCRFSNFRNTWQPAICDRVRDSTQGRGEHLALQAGGGGADLGQAGHGRIVDCAPGRRASGPGAVPSM
jgi:hypothetical protein